MNHLNTLHWGQEFMWVTACSLIGVLLLQNSTKWLRVSEAMVQFGYFVQFKAITFNFTQLVLTNLNYNFLQLLICQDKRDCIWRLGSNTENRGYVQWMGLLQTSCFILFLLLTKQNYTLTVQVLLNECKQATVTKHFSFCYCCCFVQKVLTHCQDLGCESLILMPLVSLS